MNKEHNCKETLEWLTQTQFDSNGEFTLTTVYKKCSICKDRYQVFEIRNRHTGATSEAILRYTGLTDEELKEHAWKCVGRITEKDEEEIRAKRKFNIP